MTKFEDQLYADLMRQHGQDLAGITLPTASQRHITSRRALLARTVTLAVYQAPGIAQANAKLRQLGDDVIVVPVEAGCPSITSLPAPAVKPAGPVSVGGSESSSGSITVDAHGVPAGDIMVIGVETSGQGAKRLRPEGDPRRLSYADPAE